MADSNSFWLQQSGDKANFWRKLDIQKKKEIVVRNYLIWKWLEFDLIIFLNLMKNYKEKFLNDLILTIVHGIIVYKSVVIGIFSVFSLFVLETVTRMSYITDQFRRSNFVKLRH